MANGDLVESTYVWMSALSMAEELRGISSAVRKVWKEVQYATYVTTARAALVEKTEKNAGMRASVMAAALASKELEMKMYDSLQTLKWLSSRARWLAGSSPPRLNLKSGIRLLVQVLELTCRTAGQMMTALQLASIVTTLVARESELQHRTRALEFAVRLDEVVLKARKQALKICDLTDEPVSEKQCAPKLSKVPEILAACELLKEQLKNSVFFIREVCCLARNGVLK